MRGNDLAVTGNIYPRGKDEDNIDLRFSEKGLAIASFNISAWSHKDKQTDENVYISYKAVCFGDMAEHLAESVQPGDTVIAVGRLQADNWETDEGDKRYGQSFLVDDIGLSVRWNDVQPTRTERSSGGSSSSRPKARTSTSPDEAPF